MNRYLFAAGRKTPLNVSVEDFMDAKLREWDRQHMLEEETRIIMKLLRLQVRQWNK
jgi:hypothetical protein